MKCTRRRAPHRRSAFDNRKLTARDIEILYTVYRHRLLDTGHVMTLFGSDAVRKRLTFLNHNGYLDWPHAQRALHYDGMKHAIYGISDKGAALLSETHGIAGGDFSERNRALKPWSIPHMLLGDRPRAHPGDVSGEDRLTCLVCGKTQKTLKRHLEVAHDLTPAAYREMFELKPDYPMAAPSYSRRRSEMAHRLGLGRHQTSPRRRRGRNPSSEGEAETEG